MGRELGNGGTAAKRMERAIARRAHAVSGIDEPFIRPVALVVSGGAAADRSDAGASSATALYLAAFLCRAGGRAGGGIG